MVEYNTSFRRIGAAECVGKVVEKAIVLYDAVGFRFGDGTFFFAADDEYRSLSGSSGWPIPDFALELGIIDEAEARRVEAERKRERLTERRRDLQNEEDAMRDY